MAVFAIWFAFWLAGSTFGPVQYHPDAPDPSAGPAIHEASEGGHQ